MPSTNNRLPHVYTIHRYHQWRVTSSSVLSSCRTLFTGYSSFGGAFYFRMLCYFTDCNVKSTICVRCCLVMQPKPIHHTLVQGFVLLKVTVSDKCFPGATTWWLLSPSWFTPSSATVYKHTIFELPVMLDNAPINLTVMFCISFYSKCIGCCIENKTYTRTRQCVWSFKNLYHSKRYSFLEVLCLRDTTICHI